MRKKYSLLCCLLILLSVATGCSDNDSIDEFAVADNATCQYYRTLLAKLDWGTGTTYVVGHLTPDMDATCSAISYAYLMRALGYNCEARVAGKCNRETLFTADTLGFSLPPILASADGEQLILVDHNEYSQAVEGAENAKILQVIDHHGLGSVTEASLTFSKYEPIGSTCTIVYESFRELGVNIPDTIARVLTGGILSDTDNLTKSMTTDNDSIALAALAKQLNYSTDDINRLFSRMSWARTDLSGMTNEEIFDADAKNYVINGYNIRVGNVIWIESAEDDLTHRVLSAMPGITKQYNVDMAFAIVDYYPKDNGGKKKGTFVLYYGDGAKEVAETAFGTSMEEGIIYSAKSVGRKTTFIPVVTDVLNSMEAK